MNIWGPLLDQISDGVIVSDAEKKVIYINPAGERLLDISGLHKEDINICQFLCGRLFCAGFEENRADGCVLRAPDSQNMSVTFKGRHGPHSLFYWREGHVQSRQEWKFLRVRCLKVGTPIVVGGRTGQHVTFIEDASAEVELEKRKENWSSMILHDLRTPMTNIHAVLGIFEGYKAGQALAPKDIELIDISLRGCRRMEELLDLYLGMVKIDSGVLTAHIEDLNLSALLAEAVKEQKAQADKRRIAVGVDVPLELRVRADRDLLFRVCQNLVNNSIKYVQEGGCLAITARAGQDGSIVISFKDNGPGIAAGAIPGIFDRLSQVYAHREGQMQGSRLGLIFCHDAVKAMNGMIEVESDTGKGAEFRVRLPGTAAAAGARGSSSEAARP
ncbi:MAG: PAS domain-containing sensor histidine kinase [Elusimicrobia bacterium]|nr:PAS domain-containing sensor histidine kinase [Elusimicrobiota bacterium]